MTSSLQLEVYSLSRRLRHFRYLEYGELFQNVPSRRTLADNSWVVLS